MRMAIHNAIHITTAKICEDIEQSAPAELKEPQPVRRCTRLVAIAVAAALLVVAIVMLASRIPKLQTEKKTLSSGRPTDDVKALLAYAAMEGHDINCPCESQVMSWCDVATFHIYTQDGSTRNTLNLTGDDGGFALPELCDQENQKEKDICMQILSPVFNSRDSRTYLPTASAFTSPQLLYNEIATRLDTNAYEQLNVYSFLGFINDSSNLDYTKGLVELVREMQYQFQKNSSSSAEDYWKASKGVRRNYTSVSFGFGMDVSWETYLKTCKPSFCDVEYEVSVVNRVVRAVGQVGGVTTILTLALKYLIWPSLRVSLRFPATTKSAAISNG